MSIMKNGIDANQVILVNNRARGNATQASVCSNVLTQGIPLYMPKSADNPFIDKIAVDNWANVNKFDLYQGQTSVRVNNAIPNPLESLDIWYIWQGLTRPAKYDPNAWALGTPIIQGKDGIDGGHGDGSDLDFIAEELQNVKERITELETNGSGGVAGDDEMSASDIAALMTSLARIEEVLTADGKVIPTPDMEARLARLEAWAPPTVDVCVNCGVPTEICGDCGKLIHIKTVLCVNCKKESPGLITCTHCGQSTTKHVDYFAEEREIQRNLITLAYEESIANRSYVTTHSRGTLCVNTNQTSTQMPYYYTASKAHAGCAINAQSYAMWKDAIKPENIRHDIAAHPTYTYPTPYIISPEDNSSLILHSEIYTDVGAYEALLPINHGAYIAILEQLANARTLEAIEAIVWKL